MTVPKLPRGIRWRDDVGKYQVSAQVRGVRKQVVVAGDLASARRERARLLVLLSDPDVHGTALCAYAPAVFRHRRRIGIRNADAEERDWDLHLMPRVGQLHLESVRPFHVDRLARDLAAETDLSPKSIRNLLGILSVVLQEAVHADLIAVNPCHGVPRNRGPHASPRRKRPYTTDEVRSILGSAPPDRRIIYALCSLAALPLGQACGLRWKDLVADEPMHRLSVSMTYTKSVVSASRMPLTRDVPMHQRLRAMLDTYRLWGWPASYGRRPEPADFVSPDPSTMRCRSRDQITKAFRRDIEQACVEPLGTMSLRRWAISQMRSNGARKDVVERISHHGSAGSIEALTTFSWAALCEAMALLEDPLIL